MKDVFVIMRCFDRSDISAQSTISTFWPSNISDVDERISMVQEMTSLFDQTKHVAIFIGEHLMGKRLCIAFH